MSQRHIGPTITVTASCSGCRHEAFEHYTAMGESCSTRYCTFFMPKREVYGQTPQWCPFLGAAVERRESSARSLSELTAITEEMGGYELEDAYLKSKT